MPAEFPIPLAIVGGGLAGISAAVAAAERGVRAEIFEQAPTLGGRAGSFVDSTTGERIDYCQHVAIGCCTSFLDLCRRTGLDDCFERCRTLHFFAHDGTRRDFTPSRLLPAPFHFFPALARLSFLIWSERISIVRTVARLVKTPEDSQETVAAWLRRNGQSARSMELFWTPILVSALGETLDHAALPFARKVFRECFLASRRASELILPRRPLGEIFNDHLGRWLAEHGVAVHLATPVRRIEGEAGRADSLLLADGTRRRVERVIVAVPWRSVRSLLPPSDTKPRPVVAPRTATTGRGFVSDAFSTLVSNLAAVERIEPAAITAVHLWFDRSIAPLPHAIVLGRLSQWVFANGAYLQVVISASHRLPERSHDELVNEVLGDLKSVWPAVRDARLVHSRVVTQPAALFSAVPGVDNFRPPQKTPIENLALAGDWTSTGWPATMESAVRSGFAALDAVGFGGGGRGTGDGG